MPRLIISTAAEQVATYLRKELSRGTWKGAMPGGERLAEELKIGCNTVEAALDLLEKEGLLINQGRRRGRIVAPLLVPETAPPLRIAILLGARTDHQLDYLVDLKHELNEAGHTAVFAPKSMEELGVDTKRIQQMIARTEADAWICVAGSDELLEWFAAGAKPCFALFGRRQGKRIAGAGPDKRTAYATATRRLVELGHRRIVLLARPRRRLPRPGPPEQAFLDELAAQGLPMGDYNLPDWKESPEGFHARLDALFRFTPPTALILDESALFFAALQFLGRRNIRVPEDVSLVCTDESPDFEWCRPRIARIHWESRPLIQCVLKWTAKVSHGIEYLNQTETPAEFLPGETIGPAPRST